MARGLDTANTAAVGEAVTAPRWFVRMGFATTVRLTTGATVAWATGGGTFVKADMDVSLGKMPVVSIFNEAEAFGITVLADGTAGRTIDIWKAYVSASASSSLAGYAEPVLMFSGIMSDATIGPRVIISCRRSELSFTPRTYVRPPTFNHLPKAGTVIDMPQQRIVLE